MTKDRKSEGTDIYLIDLRYAFSMNHFYEFFGENVPFSYIEQESYIDFKSMAFDLINPKIKFRKYGREKLTLTLKAEMTPEEREKLIKINKENKFRFFYDYLIENIRLYKNEEDE